MYPSGICNKTMKSLFLHKGQYENADLHPKQDIGIKTDTMWMRIRPNALNSPAMRISHTEYE